VRAAWILFGVAAVELIAIGALALLLIRSRRAAGRLAEQLQQATRPAARSPAGLAMKAVAETAARVRSQGVVSGLLMSSFEDLTRWLTEHRREIAEVAAPDGTVTIFFSDIEDSTALNEQLGDARWVRVLEAHDAAVRRQIAKRNGHVVKTQGDGFMVVFREPADAAAAAVDGQAAVTHRPVRSLRRTPIRIRIGLHIGEAVARGGDYFGRNVAMAARIAAEARGGEILISDELRASLGGADGFRLEPRGEVELKGLADRHVLWELRRTNGGPG
jgi:adenylate cyclase